MTLLQPTGTWILSCMISIITGAIAPCPGARSSHITATATPWWDIRNTPAVVQNETRDPTRILEISCISPDPNIYDIMKEASDHGRGKDYIMTFYHQNGRKYNKIGSFVIDKYAFHNILMKYSNWLLTIEKFDSNDKINQQYSPNNWKITINDPLQSIDIGRMNRNVYPGKSNLGWPKANSNANNNFNYNSAKAIPKANTNTKVNLNHANSFGRNNFVNINPYVNTRLRANELFVYEDKIKQIQSTTNVNADNNYENIKYLVTDEGAVKKVTTPADVRKLEDNVIEINQIDHPHVDLEVKDNVLSDLKTEVIDLLLNENIDEFYFEYNKPVATDLDKEAEIVDTNDLHNVDYDYIDYDPKRPQYAPFTFDYNNYYQADYQGGYSYPNSPKYDVLSPTNIQSKMSSKKFPNFNLLKNSDSPCRNRYLPPNSRAPTSEATYIQEPFSRRPSLTKMQTPSFTAAKSGKYPLQDIAAPRYEKLEPQKMTPYQEFYTEEQPANVIPFSSSAKTLPLVDIRKPDTTTLIMDSVLPCKTNPSSKISKPCYSQIVSPIEKSNRSTASYSSFLKPTFSNNFISPSSRMTPVHSDTIKSSPVYPPFTKTNPQYTEAYSSAVKTPYIELSPINNTPVTDLSHPITFSFAISLPDVPSKTESKTDNFINIPLSKPSICMPYTLQDDSKNWFTPKILSPNVTPLRSSVIEPIMLPLQEVPIHKFSAPFATKPTGITTQPPTVQESKSLPCRYGPPIQPTTGTNILPNTVLPASVTPLPSISPYSNSKANTPEYVVLNSLPFNSPKLSPISSVNLIKPLLEPISTNIIPLPPELKNPNVQYISPSSSLKPSTTQPCISLSQAMPLSQLPLSSSLSAVVPNISVKALIPSSMPCVSKQPVIPYAISSLSITPTTPYATPLPISPLSDTSLYQPLPIKMPYSTPLIKSSVSPICSTTLPTSPHSYQTHTPTFSHSLPLSMKNPTWPIRSYTPLVSSPYDELTKPVSFLDPKLSFKSPLSYKEISDLPFKGLISDISSQITESPLPVNIPLKSITPLTPVYTSSILPISPTLAYTNPCARTVYPSTQLSFQTPLNNNEIAQSILPISNSISFVKPFTTKLIPSLSTSQILTPTSVQPLATYNLRSTSSAPYREAKPMKFMGLVQNIANNIPVTSLSSTFDVPQIPCAKFSTPLGLDNIKLDYAKTLNTLISEPLALQSQAEPLQGNLLQFVSPLQPHSVPHDIPVSYLPAPSKQSLKSNVPTHGPYQPIPCPTLYSPSSSSSSLNTVPFKTALPISGTQLPIIPQNLLESYEIVKELPISKYSEVVSPTVPMKVNSNMNFIPYSAPITAPLVPHTAYLWSSLPQTSKFTHLTTLPYTELASNTFSLMSQPKFHAAFTPCKTLSSSVLDSNKATLEAAPLVPSKFSSIFSKPLTPSSINLLPQIPISPVSSDIILSSISLAPEALTATPITVMPKSSMGIPETTLSLMTSKLRPIYSPQSHLTPATIIPEYESSLISLPPVSGLKTPSTQTVSSITSPSHHLPLLISPLQPDPKYIPSLGFSPILPITPGSQVSTPLTTNVYSPTLQSAISLQPHMTALTLPHNPILSTTTISTPVQIISPLQPCDRSKTTPSLTESSTSMTSPLQPPEKPINTLSGSLISSLLTSIPIISPLQPCEISKITLSPLSSQSVSSSQFTTAPIIPPLQPSEKKSLAQMFPISPFLNSRSIVPLTSALQPVESNTITLKPKEERLTPLSTIISSSLQPSETQWLSKYLPKKNSWNSLSPAATSVLSRQIISPLQPTVTSNMFTIPSRSLKLKHSPITLISPLQPRESEKLFLQPMMTLAPTLNLELSKFPLSTPRQVISPLQLTEPPLLTPSPLSPLSRPSHTITSITTEITPLTPILGSAVPNNVKISSLSSEKAFIPLVSPLEVATSLYTPITPTTSYISKYISPLATPPLSKTSPLQHLTPLLPLSQIKESTFPTSALPLTSFVSSSFTPFPITVKEVQNIVPSEYIEAQFYTPSLRKTSLNNLKYNPISSSVITPHAMPMSALHPLSQIKTQTISNYYSPSLSTDITLNYMTPSSKVHTEYLPIPISSLNNPSPTLITPLSVNDNPLSSSIIPNPPLSPVFCLHTPLKYSTLSYTSPNNKMSVTMASPQYAKFVPSTSFLPKYSLKPVSPIAEPCPSKIPFAQYFTPLSTPTQSISHTVTTPGIPINEISSIPILSPIPSPTLSPVLPSTDTSVTTPITSLLKTAKMYSPCSIISKLSKVLYPIGITESVSATPCSPCTTPVSTVPFKLSSFSPFTPIKSTSYTSSPISTTPVTIPQYLSNSYTRLNPPTVYKSIQPMFVPSPTSVVSTSSYTTLPLATSGLLSSKTNLKYSPNTIQYSNTLKPLPVSDYITPSIATPITKTISISPILTPQKYFTLPSTNTESIASSQYVSPSKIVSTTVLPHSSISEFIPVQSPLPPVTSSITCIRHAPEITPTSTSTSVNYLPYSPIPCTHKSTPVQYYEQAIPLTSTPTTSIVSPIKLLDSTTNAELMPSTVSLTSPIQQKPLLISAYQPNPIYPQASNLFSSNSYSQYTPCNTYSSAATSSQKPLSISSLQRSPLYPKISRIISSSTSEYIPYNTQVGNSGSSSSYQPSPIYPAVTNSLSSDHYIPIENYQIPISVSTNICQPCRYMLATPTTYASYLKPCHTSSLAISPSISTKLLEIPTYSAVSNGLKFQSYQNHAPYKYQPYVNDNIIDMNTNAIKTSVRNYIANNDISKVFNSDTDLSIPLGNIIIAKKDCVNPTIQSINPAVKLKIWASNVKLIEAKVELKLKNLPVTNFQPIVNSLSQCDIQEIQMLVENYIRSKYGNVVLINNAYSINKEYELIKSASNLADDRCNLLWPVNYSNQGNPSFFKKH